MRRKRSLNLQEILLLALLATMFLSVSVSVYAGGSPVYANGSIVDDYPELSDIADFIGEKNLSVLHLLAFKACKISMESLSFSAGDSGILVLTDAGYCMIGDYTTEKCIDVIPIETGCSIGKGSLMIIHRAKGSSLWFAFFKNSTKECLYLEANSTLLKEYLDRENENPAEKYTIHKEFMELPAEKVFVKNVKEEIGADRLLNNPEEWQVKMEGKVFGGNEFSIITIANVWAKGMSYDFIQAAQLHNHICPGLISGCMIIKYLDKHLPLESPSQEYIILAVPPWCKDDAFQAILDTTVGKRKMTVMMLSKEQIEALPENAKNVAGIYIRWDKKAGKGTALVLAFDWDKASKMCGIKRAWFKDFKSYKWWWARLKMNLWMMDYLDNPEMFISTVKEVTIKSPSELMKLRYAGTNPLAELGIMPKAEIIPIWVYIVIGILLATNILTIAVWVVKVRKRT